MQNFFIFIFLDKYVYDKAYGGTSSRTGKTILA